MRFRPVGLTKYSSRAWQTGTTQALCSCLGCHAVVLRTVRHVILSDGDRNPVLWDLTGSERSHAVNVLATAPGQEFGEHYGRPHECALITRGRLRQTLPGCS
jgi:hypothetical protein